MTTLHFLDVDEPDIRDSQRRTMAAMLGVAETHSALADLQEYGFDPCTVSLLGHHAVGRGSGQPLLALASRTEATRTAPMHTAASAGPSG